MKTSIKQAFLASSLIMATAGAMAEEYYLLKEDTTTYRSFLTNPGNGYGWSSLKDPEPGNTYVVNGGYWNLYTPEASGAAGEVIAFKGDKLTLSPGYLKVMAGNAAGDVTVSVADLEIRYGAIRTARSWKNYIFNFNGKVKFDTSSYKYSLGTSSVIPDYADILNLNADVIASAHDTIVFRGGGTLSERSSDLDARGNRQYYWKRYYGTMQVHLLGDNTANFATNRVRYGAALYVGCGTLLGPVFLDNASLLCVDANSSEAAVSSVCSRDGYLRLDESKTLNAKGLDFAFADSSTYMLNGINVYTGLSADEPYVPTNVCPHTYGSTCYLNAINLGANAALTAPTASLSDTLVTLGAGATMTVGDAKLSNIKLTGDGVLEITNSLAVTGKVRILVDSSKLETVHVTMPVVLGTLNVDDFEIQEGLNPFQYRLFVKEVDGKWQLRSRNLACGAYTTANGYVSSGSKWLAVHFATADNWSDGLAPHSGAHYYVGYRTSLFYCDNGGVFQGDSLTLGRFVSDPYFTYLRTPETAKTVEIADLILLPGCKGPQAWGDTCETTFSGKMTVLTTAAQSFDFTGEQNRQAYVVASELLGWTNAVIRAQKREPSASGAGSGGPRLDFVGTNLNYYGRVIVSTNEIVRLGGDGFPRATLELATQYAITKTYPTAGKTYPVKRLELTDSVGYVEVSPDTTLQVSTLALAGRLEKSGTGTLAVTSAGDSVAGAALKVNAGGVRSDLASALNGVDLTLAEGTSIVVKYPNGGAVTPASVTLPGTVKVVVEAEVATLVADQPTMPFLTIPTPATDPVFTFDRPKRGCRYVLTKTVDGGKTTYALKFETTGLRLFVQ